MTEEKAKEFIGKVQDLCAEYGFAISSDADMMVVDLKNMSAGMLYARVSELWAGTTYGRLVWSENGEKQIKEFAVGPHV